MQVQKVNSNTTNASTNKNKKIPKYVPLTSFFLANQASNLSRNVGCAFAQNALEKFSKSYTEEDNKILKNTVVNLFDNLFDKNTKMINHNSKSLTYKNGYSKLPFGLGKIWDFIFSAQMDSVADGKNAFFNPKENINLTDNKNTIFVNLDKSPFFAFHEMGHAYNFNKSNFWKSIQNMRMVSFLVPAALVAFNAFTTKAEPKEGEELTKAQKAKNFIREKSPLIALLSTVPMLAEEAKASIRGAKWAKGLLDKNLFGKLAKSQAIAFSTYAIFSIASVIGVFLAKCLKDHFVEKNKSKNDIEINRAAANFHQG